MPKYKVLRLQTKIIRVVKNTNYIIIINIMSVRLRNFLNNDGQLTKWPSKRAAQQEVIAYIASHFSTDAQFSEAELNAEIKKLHTFGDWAILRREMCELGYFDRDKEGSVYIRTPKV